METRNKALIEEILSGKRDLMDAFSESGVWEIPGYDRFLGKNEIITKFLHPL